MGPIHGSYDNQESKEEGKEHTQHCRFLPTVPPVYLQCAPHSHHYNTHSAVDEGGQELATA